MAGLSLEGKRLLITGVLTKGSIAYTVAERAQEQGAQVVLTGFGRTRRMTERAAGRLPDPPDVLELDVNSASDLEALTGELRDRWGGVDGALHAIAFAPPDALGGNFLRTPPESAEAAFRTSAYSLKAMGEALEPLYDGGGSLVGLVHVELEHVGRLRQLPGGALGHPLGAPEAGQHHLRAAALGALRHGKGDAPPRHHAREQESLALKHQISTGSRSVSTGACACSRRHTTSTVALATSFPR